MKQLLPCFLKIEEAALATRAPQNTCCRRQLALRLAVMSCSRAQPSALLSHAGQYHMSKLNISVLMLENHITRGKQGQPECLYIFRKKKKTETERPEDTF